MSRRRPPRRPMIICWPLSMPPWSHADCCLRNTWSIRAIQTPRSWWTASARMASRLSAPWLTTPSWQARAGTGFDKAQFLVDWDRKVVTCPMGKHSISWLPNTYPQNGMTWEARFARKDCTLCRHRAQCTRSKKEPRIVGLQAQEQGIRRCGLRASTVYWASKDAFTA
jgi:Transposase DDE domain